MNRRLDIAIVLGFIAVFVMNSYCFAQTQEDSLYNAAVLSVYDNPDKAIAVGNQIFEKNADNPKKQLMALLLISNAYSSKRDYEKSLEYALKTKEISSVLGDKILNMQVLNKIAAQYHQLGVNDKALQILDEADLVTKNFDNKDSIRFLMGNNYAIRGFIYRDQLSCDIAIEYLEKAYTEFTETAESPRTMANKSVTAYNIGNCYVKLNKLELAKSSFLNAQNLAEKAKANSLHAFSLKGLAEVYTLESQYDKALQELKVAEKLADEVGDLVLNRGIFQGMSDNYLALKDWSNYQVYKAKFEETSQFIKENERKTIHTILSNYSDESKEKQSDMKWKFGLIFTGLFLSILLLLYFIIKVQIRHNSLMSALKSKIKLG